jgi:predicted Zn-dependent peptidase
VTADELGRAKDHLKGSLMLSLESTSSRMTRLAKQELYFGQSFSLDQILGAIDAVTLADMQSVVARLLDAGPLSLVALGPAGAGSIASDTLAL